VIRLRHLLIIVVAAVALRLNAATPEIRFGALKGWNVVLITVDTVDPKRIGLYGGDRRVMPFLDSLGAAGLVFDHAYCTTGSTAPSHATLLSGAAEPHHKVLYNGMGLSEKVFWLPEQLRSAGYMTAASTVAFFMGRTYRFGRGWELFTDVTVQQSPVPSNAASVRLFDESLARLREAKRPFFAWIHLKGGHEPLAPINARYLRTFAPGESPAKAPAAPTADDLPDVDTQTKIESRLLRYYDANLREADDALRLLFSEFADHNLRQHTLFIVAGDHGESFDHGWYEQHWPSPWQSTLRIPLVFYCDSSPIPRGRVNDRLVTTTDLVPTLLSLLGIQQPSGDADGVNMFGSAVRNTFLARSVSSLLLEDLIGRAAASGEKAPDAVRTALRKEASDLDHTAVFYWCLVTRDPNGHIYKLIHFGTGRPQNAMTGPGSVQLYDVTADPEEKRDLVSNGKGRDRAIALLRDARARDPFFGRADLISELLGGDPPAVLRRLDPEALAKLRALGYIQ
jgi:arylsulfatase A-like enzyme